MLCLTRTFLSHFPPHVAYPPLAMHGLPGARTFMQAQSLQTHIRFHAMTQGSGVKARASSSCALQPSMPAGQRTKLNALPDCRRTAGPSVSSCSRFFRQRLLACFCCSPATSPPAMAEEAKPTSTTGDLRSLLSSAKVPDILSEHMPTLCFEDIADFAHAYADASVISKMLDEVPAEIWVALRLASGKPWTWPNPYPLRSCTPSHEIGHSGPPPAETHASPVMAWADHLPPKLTPDLVQDLVDKFQKNFWAPIASDCLAWC